MSGRWMTAGDRTAIYRSDVPARGDGSAGNLVTRAVLRELCRVAHDAGTAQVFTDVIADRIGVSRRQVIRALARLLEDEWIARPVRGVGNRVGTGPRASVYVIRPLPDTDGRLWPAPDWVAAQWPAYTQTPRFLALSPAARTAVRAARQTLLRAVDNQPEPESNKVTVRTQQGDSPVTHTQGHERTEVPARIHPRAAARNRERMSLVIGLHMEDPK